MNTYPDAATARAAVVPQGPAEWLLPIDGRKPVRIIANDTILAGFDDGVFEQAVNTAEAPGVEQVVLGPDAHAGWGCPVGCVIISPTHVYPAPVGPDAGCSMSYLQTDLPDAAITDKTIRRALINAICQRLPTGMGSRQAPKARVIPQITLLKVVMRGASQPDLLAELGIPPSWAAHLETVSHGDPHKLGLRLAQHQSRTTAKLCQIGSYGGGNHFGEAQAVSVAPGMEPIAEAFGVKAGCVGFLSHCGSRGFGFQLMALHHRALEQRFREWGIPLPGGEKELVHAPLGTPEADAYLLDMQLALNFATVNHMLISAYVLEAFQEVIPGVRGELVYHLMHNCLLEEVVDGHKALVGRKGATRALPAGHHGLKGTRYADTGHPVLLPGNPLAGSYLMVGQPEAAKTAFSINHGGGRQMGRNHAKRTLNQAAVDKELFDADILYNGRTYPIDEAPAAYKAFDQVTASVEQAGLAKVVARLRARFVIKDMDQSAEGSA